LEIHEFRWELTPFIEGAAFEAASYVFIQKEGDTNWIPVGVYLGGNTFQWQAQEAGRFRVRVFATSGFETKDIAGQPDLDQDGCYDAIDPNPGNADPQGADGDGVATVCDVCPNDYDPLQLDSDGDLVGEACDNCPSAFNPTQADSDGDGSGDACDCASADPGVVGPPGLVTGLVASNGATPSAIHLQWDPVLAAGNGTVSDVIAGSVDVLRSQGFAGVECVVDDAPDPSAVDDFVLGPGEARWYLARADNACSSGSWDAEPVAQQVSRDPLITFDPATCPVGCSVDLIVHRFELSGGSTIGVGEDLDARVVAEVANVGTSASGSTFAGYYLSSDPVITTSDQLLIGGRDDVPALSPGSLFSVPTTMQVPSWPAGPAYLGILVDEFNAVPECDETNNTKVIPVTVQ
jgi:hypothetical protein